MATIVCRFSGVRMRVTPSQVSRACMRAMDTDKEKQTIEFLNTLTQSKPGRLIPTSVTIGFDAPPTLLEGSIDDTTFDVLLDQLSVDTINLVKRYAEKFGPSFSGEQVALNALRTVRKERGLPALASALSEIMSAIVEW